MYLTKKCGIWKQEHEITNWIEYSESLIKRKHNLIDKLLLQLQSLICVLKKKEREKYLGDVYMYFHFGWNEPISWSYTTETPEIKFNFSKYIPTPPCYIFCIFAACIKHFVRFKLRYLNLEVVFSSSFVKPQKISFPMQIGSRTHQDVEELFSDESTLAISFIRSIFKYFS